MDSAKNFATSLVAVAPSPATTGTSLTVSSGEGSKFPSVPFNAVVWPLNVQPTSANAEVVRVTNITGDVLTITRQQEGTAARTIVANDQITQTITAKLVTDVTADIAAESLRATPIGSAKIWLGNTAPPDPWLLMHGQAISRTTYAALFSVCGEIYGPGDGSTTFNLPNLQGRLPIGKDTAGALFTLGTALGGWDHTHGPGSLGVASHTHGPGTLGVASHTHDSGTLSVASHTHGPGTLGVASHTHGPGTLGVAGHTHGAGTLSSSGHNHDAGTYGTASAGSHTHEFSATSAGPSATVEAYAGGTNFAVSTNHTHDVSGTTGSDGAHTHTITGSSQSVSVNVDTGATGSTAPAVSTGATAGTAPAVSTGLTASTAPAVNAGATAAAAPGVITGASAATAPAVSSGVTAAGNPPVLVVNFIIRATA